MKRLAISCAFALFVVGGAFSQSTTIHMSGGDSTSWALVRVQPGQVAHVGDMNGIHIGDVNRDELIIVRGGKGYVVTDAKVLSEVEAARAPLDALREERMKLKEQSREVRMEQRDIERERRTMERARQRIQQRDGRAGDAEKRDLEKQMSDLSHKESDLDKKVSGVNERLATANKRVEEMDRKRNAARDEVMKKIEKIFDNAIAHGLAHPLN
jgi:uncharacterized protein (DUF3084 family)